MTEQTTDILIETATFDPVSVRNTSRRLNIASDSSFRFERGVHPGQIECAGDRLAELILELCGGELCEGVVADGPAIPPRRQVSMRCDRCRKILGVPVDDEKIVDALARLDFQPELVESAGKAGGASVQCVVPHHRLDIEREVDLIEEVGRMYGHDNIPIAETLSIRIAPPQSEVMAKRAVNDALVGMGYLETTTHSLISEQAAKLFLAEGMEVQRLDDDRGRAEPILRPSLLPSLLRVYAHNRDNGAVDVRLFETGSTFARQGSDQGSKHLEAVNLAIVHPAMAEPDHALREMRGVIDRLVQLVLGPEAAIEVRQDQSLPWFDACAVAELEGRTLGCFGLLSAKVVEGFGIDAGKGLFAAELGLPAYYDRYPPETEAKALPAFPAIERDVSAILAEEAQWAEVRAAVEQTGAEHLEAVEFITTFRGRQLEKSTKSLTLRARFRAPDRTLRHEEVDVAMDTIVNTLQEKFSATIRN